MKLTANRDAVRSLISKAIRIGGSTAQFSNPSETTGFRTLTKLAKGKAREFNRGGAVDTVPALLTPGEFVINRDSASRIGLRTLRQLNNVDKFANGGSVGKVPFQDGGLVGGGASSGGLGDILKSVIDSNSELKDSIERNTKIQDQRNNPPGRGGGTTAGGLNVPADAAFDPQGNRDDAFRALELENARVATEANRQAQEYLKVRKEVVDEDKKAVETYEKTLSSNAAAARERRERESRPKLVVGPGGVLIPAPQGPTSRTPVNIGPGGVILPPTEPPRPFLLPGGAPREGPGFGPGFASGGSGIFLKRQQILGNDARKTAELRKKTLKLEEENFKAQSKQIKRGTDEGLKALIRRGPTQRTNETLRGSTGSAFETLLGAGNRPFFGPGGGPNVGRGGRGPRGRGRLLASLRKGIGGRVNRAREFLNDPEARLGLQIAGQSIATGIGLLNQRNRDASSASVIGSIQGAISGGTAGAAFGPVGAAIGAVGGAALAGTQAFIDTANRKAQEDLAKSTEDLGKAFEDLQNTSGKTVAQIADLNANFKAAARATGNAAIAQAGLSGINRAGVTGTLLSGATNVFDALPAPVRDALGFGGLGLLTGGLISSNTPSTSSSADAINRVGVGNFLGGTLRTPGFGFTRASQTGLQNTFARDIAKQDNEDVRSLQASLSPLAQTTTARIAQQTAQGISFEKIFNDLSSQEKVALLSQDDRRAGSIQRQIQEGRTAGQIVKSFKSRDTEGEADQSRRLALEIRNEQQAKQDVITATRQYREEVDLLVVRLEKFSASLSRVGEGAVEATNRRAILSARAGGGFSFGTVNRNRENLFANPTAFTRQELQGGIAQLRAQTGGGAAFEEVARTALSAQTIQNRIPALLAQATNQGLFDVKSGGRQCRRFL